MQGISGHLLHQGPSADDKPRLWTTEYLVATEGDKIGAERNSLSDNRLLRQVVSTQINEGAAAEILHHGDAPASSDCDEIREFDGIDVSDIELSKQEMQMATALVDMLKDDFDPSQYRDEYREALMDRITAKLEGGEIVVDTEQPAPAQTVDLMAALKASIEATQARKGGTARKVAEETEAEQPEPKKPARARRTAPKAAAGGGRKRAS